ncbi:MAG: hypothetical protein ABFD89_18430 [Bryobacteraceae bacterium]
MKTVRLDRDFVYKPKRNVHVAYKGGVTYQRVPEAAVRVIVAAKAGEVIEMQETEN